MLNQPHHPFEPQLTPESWSAGSWQTDQNPSLRLGLLLMAMTVPLLAVAGRVYWLQAEVRDQFLARYSETYEVIESIPAADGRIISSDGQVLAHDEEYFNLEVHYRWFETPVDPAWLRSQAYERLSRADRRVPGKIQQAEKDVLKSRQQLWQHLSQLTGQSPEELFHKREQIQTRIEGIVRLVEQKRLDQRSTQESLPTEAVKGEWWERLVGKVRHELTTPPSRGIKESLIIREELDYHSLIENISFEAVAEIEAHPEIYPGLHVTYGTRRMYPHGSLASHVVGHRAEMDQNVDEANASSLGVNPLDYRHQDRRGMTGVERSYDRILRGLRGERKTVRNRQGEIMSSEVVRKPRPGQDVVLTIDSVLQHRTEEIIDRKLQADPSTVVEAGASIVVIDVRTGEVVSCANGPRHNLQVFSEFDAQLWQSMMDDPRRPFFPRATNMAIAPGSVFKTVTAVSLLQSGKVDPDEPYACQGYLHSPQRYRCYVYRHYGIGHGEIRLREAIAQSCNVYFYQAGLSTGPDEMIYWADKLGFGRPTGIDLPGEAGGNLPRPGYLAPGSRDRWQQSETLGLAIGQSRLTTTPLQIARWMSIIANNGYGFTPRLVQRTGSVTTTGTSPHTMSTMQPIPGLDETTLQRIREGMDRVVNWHRGTGYKTVRLPNVRIAGKTGTAEVGAGKQDHAWFAGYVPVDNPKYAFAIVVEHGGGGGSAAGPLAKQLVQSLIDLGMLESTTVSQK
ncbi:penicillin-binding transpeptidase domain-containing protein [Planctomycetaceae bacterium]|nr:penicillin-binding transpeptidase domain-containing protein [Planctomycetaceae bacterium]